MDSVANAHDRIMAAIAPCAPNQQADLVASPYPLPAVMQPVSGDSPLPPYDRVAMDGIAICLAEVGHSMPAIDGKRQFRREGMQPAGARPLSLTDRVGGCIEVMTGAVLPAGCDTVINYERLKPVDGGFLYSQGDLLHEFEIGSNVHHCGSDYPDRFSHIEAAALATAPVAGLLASVGQQSYATPYEPTVAIVATGDELVPVAAKPEPHQIRRSNSFALQQLLASYGFRQVSCHHLTDQPEQIEQFLQVTDADVIVFSGGVSKGRKDHIPEVIATVGGETLVHGVSQRPGKPLLFAVLPTPPTSSAASHAPNHAASQPSRSQQYVFGLPGNPVSTLVCGLRYLIPALRRIASTDRWQGMWGVPAMLSADYSFGKKLTRFVPVTLKISDSARLEATPIAIGGSGDFASLIHSDGVIELPAEPSSFAAGGCYPFYGWNPLATFGQGGGL